MIKTNKKLFTVLGCKKIETTSDIKLGATFPLTGEVASYGQKAKRGIEMAVEEINAKGGVLGRKVVIDFQDDRNDKKEAVTIVTKFATIDKVPVVFGSAGSSATLAIAPIANQNKVVLITPVSSSSQLSTEGGKYFFRTVPADDLQATILSDWVFDSGAKNVAIVFTNNSWGKPLAEGFQRKYTAKGGKVLLSEGVAENAGDLRTVISKIKKLQNLDAVVSPTYPKEGGTFVKQLKELGLKVQLFGGDNWGSPEFLNIAGQAAERVFYTAPAESKSQPFNDFAQRYKAKYGEEPDIFGAYAYDAANAIFKAIETGKSTEADKIREALLKVSFTGVSGEIAFRPNGDLVAEAFSKKTIKDGKSISKM
jgi:branched-chain amino acid transport system substrate-binding protein